MGEDLAQYRIKGSDLDWGQALAGTKAKQLVSVKRYCELANTSSCPPARYQSKMIPR